VAGDAFCFDGSDERFQPVKKVSGTERSGNPVSQKTEVRLSQHFLPPNHLGKIFPAITHDAVPGSLLTSPENWTLWAKGFLFSEATKDGVAVHRAPLESGVDPWLHLELSIPDRAVGSQRSGTTTPSDVPVHSRRVAVGYGDGTVMVFEPLTGRPLAHWRPHTERVRELVWSASGEQLATYGAANCGSLELNDCVMATRFPAGKPMSVPLWRSDKFDLSPSLGWMNETQLLLDDSHSTAFTVNAPER
jgi:WD40 repeat protein